MKKFYILCIVCFLANICKAQVFKEDFEGALLSKGWQSSSPTNTQWQTSDCTYKGPGKAYSGSKGLIFNNYDFQTGNQGILTSPEFDVSTQKNPQISFFWWNGDKADSPARIIIKTSTDGNTFTQLDALDVHSSTDWTEYTHSIPKDVIKIQLIGISDYGNKNTFLDLLSIGDPADYEFLSTSEVNTSNTELSQKAEFSFEIENKGALSDTYTISYTSSNSWLWKTTETASNLAITEIEIAAGSSKTISLSSLLASEGINHGQEEKVKINISSKGESSLTSTLNYSVVVIAPLVSTSGNFSFSFNDITSTDLPLGWRIANKDNNNNKWESSVSKNCMELNYKYDSTDDWLFSQPLVLEANTSYRIRLKLRGGTSFNKANFYISASNDISNITNDDKQIFAKETFHIGEYEEIDAYFNSSVQGSYRIGFHGKSSASIYIDDIIIDKAPDYEVRINSDILNTNIVAGESYQYNFVLSNKGGKTDIIDLSVETKFPSQILNSTGEKISNISLAPQENQDITLKIEIPSMGQLNGETNAIKLNAISQSMAEKTSSHSIETKMYVAYEYPFVENFESNISKWNIDTDNTVLSEENKFAGNKSLHLKSIRNTSNVLELNSFIDLTDAIAPVLEFKHNASMGAYDKFKVEIQIYGEDRASGLEGELYTGMPKYDSYSSNNAFGAKSFSPWADIDHFDSEAWQNALFDLSEYKGKKIIIKLDADYGSYIGQGWLIDNLAVKEAPEYIFTIETEDKISKTKTGDTSSHTITINNKGSKEDTYTLSCSKNIWTNTFQNQAGEAITEISIAAGASSSIIVKSTVASDASMGDADNAEISISSGGDSTQSNIIKIVTKAISNISVPYYENFDDKDANNLLGWKVLNTNENNKVWSIESYYSHSSSNTYTINNRYTNEEMDDWLISPPLLLEEGKTYRLSNYIRSIGSDVEKISIHYAQSSNIEDFKENTLFTKEDLNSKEHTKYISNFTATASGVYYIAYHAYSKSRTSGIAIDDFNLDLLLENDLKINSIDINQKGFIIENSNLTFSLELENNGSSIARGKTISMNNNSTIVKTINIDDLAVGEKQTIEFTYSPSIGINQEFIFSLNSDDNNTNNNTQISIDTFKEGLLLEDFETDIFPSNDTWSLASIAGADWMQYKSGGYQSVNNAILKANYSNSSDSRIITPKLFIQANSKLIFYAKRSSSIENKLSIEYINSEEEFIKLNDISLEEEYTKYTIDLSSLEGKKVKLAFHGTTPAKYGEEIRIDRIVGPMLAGSLKSEMTINPQLGGLAHDFGNINLGEKSDSFDINIKNTGNALLTIEQDNIEIRGTNASDFALNTNFPFTISPNEIFKLQVTCEAISVGNKKADLYIIDPNSAKNISVKQFSCIVNPPKLRLLSPANSIDEVMLTPTLTWDNIDGDYKIDLYISKDKIFDAEDLVINEQAFVNKYTLQENLIYGQRYFWKLVLKKNIGEKTYTTSSEVNNFTIEKGENIVQIGATDKLSKGLESLPMSCGVDDLAYMTYSQSLYFKDEINIESKRIKQIFYYYNGAEAFQEEIVVYMANTEKEELAVRENAWVAYENLSEVYRGAFNTPDVEGWVSIDLPVAFDYDNTKNLVIGFDSSKKTISNSEAGFYFTKDDSRFVTKYKRHHADGGKPDPSDPNLSGLSSRRKPIIRLGLVDTPKKPIIYLKKNKISFPVSGFFQRPIQTINVANIGIGSLLISEISISGDDNDNFIIESPTASPVNILAGKKQEVKIKFRPLSIGKKSAFLHIKSQGCEDIIIPIHAESLDTKISKFPYTEGFEGDIFPIPGWNTDKHWMLAGSGHESNHSATCYYNRVDDAIITSPTISLPANHRLTFMWKNRYTPESRLENFDFTYVEISEDNGLSWTELNHYTLAKESMIFEKFTIDLSAYANKEIKLRWRHSITNIGYRTMQAITLDDITIEETPYTPAVEELSLEIKDDNNIYISWDAPEMDASKPDNTIVSYELYRNGKLIHREASLETNFLDKNLKRGEYEYILRVRYEKGDSDFSMPDKIIVDIEEAFPVKGLDAEVINISEKVKNVKLSWNKPIKKKTIKRLPSDDTYGLAKTGKYNQEQLWVSNYEPKGHLEQTMFKFDLEGLSADKIDKVTLRMNQLFMANDYNTEASKVYAITEDWKETEYDFSRKPEYDESKVWAEYYFGGNGWQEIDITELVKAWLNGSIENNGLCLVASLGDRLRVFDSKESFIEANRPHINIITEEDSSVENPNHGHGISYNIYRNGEKITNIDNFDTLEYTDTNLEPNFYSYTISAVYSKAGESEESKSKIVNVALGEESAWTWMIYMYEDSTGLSGAEDINELEVLGSVPGMVNYVVFYDSDDDEKDGIYLVEKDPEGENNTIISKKISSQFGKDPRMSDWNLLSDFMLWTKEQFPARNYALTMWDHGNGIFRSEGETVRSFVGNMNLWEMDKALAKFTQADGKKLEIVGFDLCLLGQAETVYQLKDYTKYLIASEKTEPGDGWDYVTQFAALNNNPMMSSREICTEIVDRYIESYSPGGNSNVASVTQAATDTEVFEKEMIPALNAFAGSLIDNMYKYKQYIVKAREYSWNSKRNVDHKDIGDFARLISESKELPVDLKNAAKAFTLAYNKSIVATGSTERANENTTGLRVWIPKEISKEGDNANIYLDPVNFLRFNETLWDEFIFNYENPTENPNRLTVEKTEYIINANTTTLSIPVNKTGDGEVYWNIDQLSTWFTTNDTQLLNTNNIELKIDANKGSKRDGKIFITAKGVIGCPIEIKIIQESDIIALKTHSTLVKQNTVSVSWILPNSSVEVSKINVFRNNVLIEEITDTSISSYNDVNLADGDYVYNVQLVYGEYETTKSESTQARVQTKMLISNFNAQVDALNVNLSWEMDDTISDFVSYDIYHNDTKIASISDVNTKQYTYSSEIYGKHSFHIKLVYDNAVSEKSQSIKANIDIAIKSHSTTVNQNTVNISWTVPESSIELSKVNIFRNNELIAEITDANISSYDDSNLGDGDYIYNTQLVYGEYETAKSKNTQVRVQTGMMISNVTAQVDALNVNLSWEMDDTISDFVSYDIYLNENKITSITDINTNEYVYSSEEHGSHEFYIKLIYTNASSKKSESVIVNIEKLTTGINDIELKEISIYPNPVTSTFVFINTGNLYISKIELYNLHGRLIYRKNTSDTQYEKLDMSSISKGIYILKINTDKGIRTEKIIKH